jgi:hypothetical protein
MIAVAIVAAGVLIAGYVVFGGRERWDTGSPSTSVDANGVKTAASPPEAARGFQALKGRWLRLDGGYVLEFRAIDAAGAIDAAYLNPRPINVARAEATLDGSILMVFVELQAPNYPGSTYTLSYDAQRDQLAGVYFQAALQQRFDVVFSRIE